jgi:polysaccharide biosynthesis/export protein
MHKPWPLFLQLLFLNKTVLMKILRTVFLLILPVYFFSCGPQKKAAAYYLDRASDTTVKRAVTFPELRIQKNDLLSIHVYSASTNPEVDRIFNLPGSESGSQASGYLVDARGDIEYPRLGTIHVEGLTKQELGEIIKKKLTEPIELLKNPTVIIRFLNYKITVLGQVGREGLVTLPSEKVTILEAIGMAGGITDFGKKDKVKIIREINGQREIGYIDLSSDSLFLSPYYNMMQNDVVIVEPTKQKSKQQDQAVVAQRISMAIGIITAAAFIYNVFQ